MLNAHTNPDAQGISPHDIYGIDAKSFREQIQGLAVTFPKYIRVSFIGNLDNIILEDFQAQILLIWHRKNRGVKGYAEKYSDYIEISPNFESVVDIGADTRKPNLWRDYIVGEDMEKW